MLYFCNISISLSLLVQIVRIEFSILVIKKVVSYFSGVVESRWINWRESFFKNLKRASFFVQISRKLSSLESVRFSFSVKKRGERQDFDISSTSIPIFTSLESLIAIAEKVSEWDIETS